ncbi:hypothetical protein CLOM_g7867 [Closterium sp. NIES-68]|nr:hypothetical protein CLOM_g7867 [Closterium sp. NIES-68]
MLLDLQLLSALDATDCTKARVTSSQGLPFNGFALPWAAEFVPSSTSLGAMVSADRASGVSNSNGDYNGGATMRRQQLAAKWLELCAAAAADAGKDCAGEWDAERNDALFEVLSRALLALRMDEILANGVTGTVDEEEEEAASAGAGVGETGGGAESARRTRW